MGSRPISTKIGRVEGAHDVITTSFYFYPILVLIFLGVSYLQGVKSLHCPIDFADGTV